MSRPNFWNSLFSHSRNTPTQQRSPRRPPLTLELLEDRITPAVFVWDGGGADDKWSTGDNWVSNSAPTGFDDLIFPATAARKDTNSNDLSHAIRSITLSGSGYILGGDGLTLGNATPGTGTVTVQVGVTGTIALNLALARPSGSRQIITVSPNAELTITGQLSTATGVELAKQGSGTLILSGDNSNFTGPIALDDSAGTVRITHANALGDSNAPTRVGNNAQLEVSNVADPIPEPLIVNGAGVTGVGALLNVAGNNTWAGPIELTSNATIGAGADSLDITGTISDGTSAARNLIKEGVGQIILSAANTYRGTTTVNNGVLTLRHAEALGFADGAADNGTVVNATYAGGTGLVLKAGALQLDGTLQDPSLPFDADTNPYIGFAVNNERLVLNGPGNLNATPDLGGAFQNSRVENSWNGGVILGSPSPNGHDATIGVGAGTTLIIIGVVSDPHQVVDLHKQNDGTLIFTNANTYRGDTFIDAGTLVITDSQGLGSIEDYLAGLPGSTIVGGKGTLQLSIDDQPDSLTGTTDQLALYEELSLVVDEDGNRGRLHNQSGTNTYVALNDSLWYGDVELGESLTIDVGAAARLRILGTVDDATSTIETGSELIKAGDGELVLAGANYYRGLTRIDAGTLTVEHQLGLGGTSEGTVVAAGAALQLQNSITVVGEGVTLQGAGAAAPGLLQPRWFRQANAFPGIERIDPNNPNIVFRIANGALLKSTTGSNGNFAQILNATNGTSPTFPFLIDNVNPSRLLAGGFSYAGRTSALQESPNGGGVWLNLNPPISSVTALAAATYQGEFEADSGFSSVTDMGGATYDPNTMYISNGSTVFVTKNRGQTWVNRTGNLPGNITDLAVDPRNRDMAYAVSSTGMVFRTATAGSGWHDLEFPLALAISKVLLDPRNDTVYVGTDQGVYSGSPSGTGWVWEPFGVGVETTPVKDLVLDERLNTLTVVSATGSVSRAYLSNVPANAGALRAVTEGNVWTGSVQLFGDSVTLSANVGSSLNILGSISDGDSNTAPQLVKIGQGDVILSGINTYQGVTAIQEGALESRNANALGSPQAGTTVSEAAALNLASDLAAEPIALHGHGLLAWVNGPSTGALRNVSGFNTYSGALSLGTDASLGVDFGARLTIGTKAGLSGNGSFLVDLRVPSSATNKLTILGLGEFRIEGALLQGSVSEGVQIGDSFTILEAPEITAQFAGLFGASEVAIDGQHFQVEIVAATVSTPVEIVLTRALSQATVQVTAPDRMYNGAAFGAAASVASADGNFDATLEGVGVTLAYHIGANASGELLPEAPTDAGTYTVVALFPGSANYASTTASVTFTISPALLTVTVDSDPITSVIDVFGKYSGRPNPSFRVRYDGFVLNETPAVLDGTLSFSTPATTTSPAGSYPVMATGLTSSNYALTFVPGTLVVTLEILRGDNTDNIWIITGHNEVSLNGRTYSGIGTLVGGSANDRFSFRPGGRLDGSIDGGLGVNTLSYSALATDVSIDLGAGTATGADAGVFHILNVFGGAGNDILIGDAGDNLLVGLAGNDTLVGAAGYDHLDGGAGDDTYEFNSSTSLGADQIDEFEGGGDDRLDFSSSSLGVTVDLGTHRIQQVNSNLILTLLLADTMENVTGTPHADSLTGNQLPNILNGRAGNNTLVAVGGNDTITAGNGNNFIDAGGGSDTILVRGDGNNEIRGRSGNNTITIEGNGANQVTTGSGHDRVTITGHGNNTVKVGAGNDRVVIVGDGSNTLDGGAGNDILVGGSGNDTLYGRADRDVLIGGRGADVLFGLADDDLLVAGYTSFDANFVALQAILAEWTSSHSYEDRVANLLGVSQGRVFLFNQRLNENYFLSGVDVAGGTGTQTVFSDTSVDELTGNGDRDWYFANTLQDSGGTPAQDVLDVVRGLANGERATDSDFDVE